MSSCRQFTPSGRALPGGEQAGLLLELYLITDGEQLAQPPRKPTKTIPGDGIDNDALSWTPTANDIGEHAVVLRVTDSVGGAAVQAFSLSVLGSPLKFVSQPPLIAAAGTEYRYQPQVARGVGQSVLSFDFDSTVCSGTGGGNLSCSIVGAVRGMALNQQTGELLWTPGLDQLGTHEVILTVRDQDGNVGKQFFDIEVLEANVAPRITTQAVTQAVVHAHYHYDVDAADLGTREVLSYTLTQWPQGMTIDMVTGVISWQPSATGSYSGLSSPPSRPRSPLIFNIASTWSRSTTARGW